MYTIEDHCRARKGRFLFEVPIAMTMAVEDFQNENIFGKEKE